MYGSIIDEFYPGIQQYHHRLQGCPCIALRNHSSQRTFGANLHANLGGLYKHMLKYDLALSIYRQFYVDEPELVEAKETEIMNFFAMSGIGMAKSILGRE